MNDLYIRHGGIPPYKILISHNWTEVGAIFQVIWEFKADLFVEIGVHRGGLGSMIVPFCNYDKYFHYLGFEVDRKITETCFIEHCEESPRANLVFDDVFSKPSMNAIRDAIFMSTVPLIYCDGGNKALEFQTLAPLVPAGTLLMVHDYPKEFREEHWWNVKNVRRVKLPYLEDNRQVLFMKMESI